MLVSELTQLRPLALTELHNVEEALKIMQAEEIRCIPVIDSSNETWLGNVYKDQVKTLPSDQNLSEVISKDAAFVHIGQHSIDATGVLLKFNVDILPVISNGNHYEGFVSREQLAEVVQRQINAEELGSILFVQMETRDYTLANVVRLIEVEGAKILGILVQTPDAINQEFRISFKINLQDASRVTESLRRHGYVVTNPTGEELLDSEIEHRADELLHFLEL